MNALRLAWGLALLWAFATCDDGQPTRLLDGRAGRIDGGGGDTAGDATRADSIADGPREAGEPGDAGALDALLFDAGVTADTRPADLLAHPDTRPADLLAHPDLSHPDASLCGNTKLDPGETCDDGLTIHCTTDHDGGDGRCVPQGTCSSGYVLDAHGDCVTNGTGLTVPCSVGSGWTLFRFHYGGGTSPSIDVWDATCSYSYAPTSACNVYAIYPGFGSVSYTSQGYPILTTSEYLRVRFSVTGLSFSKAALYIQARSYATAASTYYEVWSPLYGGLIGGPVDNDWTYDWYGLDWTGHLTPQDAPGMTAIQIYAGQGSGQLAVKAVELCVE